MKNQDFKDSVKPFTLRTHPTSAGTVNQFGRLLINFMPCNGMRFDFYNDDECHQMKIEMLNEDENTLMLCDVDGNYQFRFYGVCMP